MKNCISLRIIVPLVLFIGLSACSNNNNSPTPKPRAYPRVERKADSFVEHKLRDICFQYPIEAKLVEQPSDGSGIWFNLEYPEFKAKLYCTVTQARKEKIELFIKDNYRLIGGVLAVNSHARILEDDFEDRDKPMYGILYTLEGNPVNPYQFYLTDSVSYFFRGTLYYNQKVKSDSVASVTESLKGDIVKLMETFSYKSRN